LLNSSKTSLKQQFLQKAKIKNQTILTIAENLITSTNSILSNSIFGKFLSYFPG